MVIPIVAMLAVTMIVAGYRDEGEPIEVDEGYDEMTVVVPPPPGDEVNEIDFRDNESYRVTARSEINDGEGFLEIDVKLGKWIGLSEQPRYHHDNQYVNINGHLGPEYDLGRLIVEAEVIKSPALERGEERDLLRFKYLYSVDYGEKGLETRSLEEMESSNLGEKVFVYYEVEEDNFSVEHLPLDCEHNYHSSLVEEPITIEYRAILEGLQDEIRATARVTYTQEEM